ncbi:hypothetical protein LTR08_004579 [Meristemomyces frigidus]|nr:hypothetical protein LTR08_004579 [Meristemomyces frigidus]
MSVYTRPVGVSKTILKKAEDYKFLPERLVPNNAPLDPVTYTRCTVNIAKNKPKDYDISEICYKPYTKNRRGTYTIDKDNSNVDAPNAVNNASNDGDDDDDNDDEDDNDDADDDDNNNNNDRAGAA